MGLSQQDHDRRHMNKSKEVAGCLLIPRGDPSVLLQRRRSFPNAAYSAGLSSSSMASQAAIVVVEEAGSSEGAGLPSRWAW